VFSVSGWLRAFEGLFDDTNEESCQSQIGIEGSCLSRLGKHIPLVLSDFVNDASKLGGEMLSGRVIHNDIPKEGSNSYRRLGDRGRGKRLSEMMIGAAIVRLLLPRLPEFE
jgi:hypothetical protein